MLLLSFFYWFGFSAVSDINAARYFSLIDAFTNIPNSTRGVLIIVSLVRAIMSVLIISLRSSHLRFVDDPAVKIPPPKRETVANLGVNPDVPDAAFEHRHNAASPGAAAVLVGLVA